MAQTKREIKTTLALDGEKQFKTSMDEAYRAMKVLGSEMKLNTALFSDNASGVEALTKKGEILGKQISQQKEIITALSKAVEDSSKANGESSKQTDEYRIKLNNAEAALSRMESQLNDTEKEIKSNTKSTEELSKKWDKAGDVLEKAGKKASAISAGIAAAAAATVKFTVDAGKMADELITTSNVTGVSTEELQRWTYAAKFIDTEVDTMTGSMAKMIKNMATASKGTGDAYAAFDALKVSIKDSSGQLRDSQTVFFEAIDALGRVENETERNAIAMQIFGKSAQELNPLILAGSQELIRLGDEAENAGLILSDTALKSLGSFDDSMQRMTSQVEAAKNSLAVAFAPAIESVVNVLQKAAESVTDFINGLDENTKSAILIIGGITAAIGPLLVMLGQMATGISAIIKIWPTFTAALSANSVGLILTGIAIAAVAVGTALSNAAHSTEDLVNSITPFKESISSITPTLLDVNDLLSTSGKTVAQLDQAIRDSEQQITSVLATALEENRMLRQDELDSIRNFNDQVLALQAEKLQLYRDQQLAELRKLQLEESALTQEQAAQRVANMSASLSQANAITEEAYTAQLTIIENKYRTMNAIGSQAYTEEQNAARTHYETSLAENKSYLQDGYKTVAESAARWVAKDKEKWDNLNDWNKFSSRQYVAALNQMDVDSAEAFFSTVATAKKYGAQISGETARTASSILDAFDNLAPFMELAGRDVLLGMIGGMKDEIPGLENISEMSADEIVKAIKSALDINSPSRVMAGIGENISKGLVAGLQGDKS